MDLLWLYCYVDLNYLDVDKDLETLYLSILFHYPLTAPWIYVYLSLVSLYISHSLSLSLPIFISLCFFPSVLLTHLSPFTSFTTKSPFPSTSLSPSIYAKLYLPLYLSLFLYPPFSLSPSSNYISPSPSPLSLYTLIKITCITNFLQT